MKALISTQEVFDISYISAWENGQPQSITIENCQRVAEVAETTFDVYPDLQWVDCPDDCVADEWYYKGGQLYKKPEDAPNPD